MKKITVLFAFGILSFVLTSFKSSIFTDYGPWKTTSCFKGLDYCVKRASYNEYSKKYEWWVKFRNRYNEKVTFNCVLKESNVYSANGNNRLDVEANSEGGEMWFLVADANAVKVFIDKLRFGNEDWGTKYASCDN
jgi:hypothetical protein